MDIIHKEICDKCLVFCWKRELFEGSVILPTWHAVLCSMAENRERHSESSDWIKTVPSYNQTNSSMDFRNYMMRDENLEPLPKNWEMAYTDTGMVYFIE